MLSIETLDKVKGRANELAREAARKPGVLYADVRLELGETVAAIAENGAPRRAAKDAYLDLGVRVIASEAPPAAGHVGLELGAAEEDRLPEIIQDALLRASERAVANARSKMEARKRFTSLGKSLQSWELASIPVSQVTLEAEYDIDPCSVTPETASRLVADISTRLAAEDKRIVYNGAQAESSIIRFLFASSEGTLIDRPYTLTLGAVFLVAANGAVTQEHYDYIGHQRGWELLTEGFDDGYIRSLPLAPTGLQLARDTIELCEAPALKSTGKPVVVVTDPNFNALLVHEIIGHPTEADRILKWETAYAGRSWLFGDREHNQIGKQIASELITAYSDPALPGFGHYPFDDEGTPVKRVALIERGMMKGFMNSRETAGLLKAEPNGHYKASKASLVPLIRMSNTVFEAGQTPPEKLISEIDDGWYLSGMRIPSISESRENFRISAKKIFEIKNGRLGRLYRDGGITSDSRDFLMNVDGVGNDFNLFAIPNCGKGQPMQIKKLGNGSPTLRSRARLAGA